MPQIKLDSNGDTEVPNGYILIETEVAFLQYAVSGQALIIKGVKLCRWAESFYSGRQIRFQEVNSPMKHLMSTYPEMTGDQADFILRSLGDSVNGLADFNANSIMNTWDPRQMWEMAPSFQHAAEWLLWLDEKMPDDSFEPILKVIGDNWRYKKPELGEIYKIHDAQKAHVVLAQWLGETITPFLEKFGEFPLPIPPNWTDQLAKSWKAQVVHSKGEFLESFLTTPTAWSSKQLVATIALDYYEKNREGLTKQRHDQIARFVTGKDRTRLLAIHASPEPNPMPDSPEEIKIWFIKEYLPFREWQLGTNAENSYHRVVELGMTFAKWYLDFYPQALISKEHLSFFRSTQLKEQDQEYVDLLIILDGLHVLDAQYLMSTLLKTGNNSSLSMIENDTCFAPLPTVTDFAKGALLHGVQPTLMKEIDMLGTDVSERQTPLPLLQTSKPGDLFIWRIQDPDYTYHTKNRSPMLKMDVEGVLSTIAKKIYDLVEKVDSSIPLKIIITTDHGRFLGKSTRNIDVPLGMASEGRAAWGKSNIPFERSGYKIEGDLAYLSKDRYGLMDDDAAVILSDCAFKHETYKEEISTHGGLFPEEVIIPWMVFERKEVTPEVEINLSGDGRADSPGTILVSLLNTCSMDLIITKAELLFSPEKKYVFEVSIPISGMHDGQFELQITSWPSSEQVSTGKALFVVDLPNGGKQSISPSLDKIKVSELYTRDKTILEGLDL